MRFTQASIKPDDVAKYAGGGTESTTVAAVADGLKPSLESCINIYDFEAIASRVCPEQGWVYYSSGADDEITLRENHNAFHRIWFKPRVMVNVKEIDMSTTILGHKTSMPMMLSAVAMCKLGHPDGEVAWHKGAGEEGIIYMIPTLSGCAFKDIIAARKDPSTPMFFQLYVNQDKEKTKKLVQKAEAAGCSALFITCDAPQLGNRERDRRVKVSHSGAAAQAGGKVKKSEGTSKALTTFIDPSLNWDDIPWYRSITKMKIVLKGVATAEDAVLALEKGIDAVMLSNHGGRQLDFARSAIEALPEVMQALRAHPGYDPAKFEVFIDGGVRRGSDIFKALALGAKAVGVGRPALYAMTAFGAEGVQRMIQIMKSELTMTMRLMGTPSIADINPTGKQLITTDLGRHVAMVPPDMLQRETYIPPVTQAYMNRLERVGAKPVPAAGTSAAAPAKAAGADSSEAVVVLIVETLKSVAKTIVTLDPRLSIHRTAVFMFAFLVVHAFGNLLFFAGKDALNQYATFLNTGIMGQIIYAIEIYLLATVTAHVVASSYLTFKFNKLKPSKKDPIYMYPFGQAKLFLSGMCIAAYVFIHLTHFKFGPIENTADGLRDIYSLNLKVFADQNTTAMYCLGVATMGFHLYAGWPKTVLKFSPEAKPYTKELAYLGQMLALSVSASFIASAIGAHVASV